MPRRDHTTVLMRNDLRVLEVIVRDVRILVIMAYIYTPYNLNIGYIWLLFKVKIMGALWTR